MARFVWMTPADALIQLRLHHWHPHPRPTIVRFQLWTDQQSERRSSNDRIPTRLSLSLSSRWSRCYLVSFLFSLLDIDGHVHDQVKDEHQVKRHHRLQDNRRQRRTAEPGGGRSPSTTTSCSMSIASMMINRLWTWSPTRSDGFYETGEWTSVVTEGIQNGSNQESPLLCCLCLVFAVNLISNRHSRLDNWFKPTVHRCISPLPFMFVSRFNASDLLSDVFQINSASFCYSDEHGHIAGNHWWTVVSLEFVTNLSAELSSSCLFRNLWRLRQNRVRFIFQESFCSTCMQFRTVFLPIDLECALWAMLFSWSFLFSWCLRWRIT